MQTSLAEADHYSHIAECKHGEPWHGREPLPPPQSGYAATIMVFFAHLVMLEYPDHHQNLTSSSLHYAGLLHKMLSQSVHNFLSNLVHTQTNKQTNKQTNAAKNITSFAKEVMIPRL